MDKLDGFERIVRAYDMPACLDDDVSSDIEEIFEDRDVLAVWVNADSGAYFIEWPATYQRGEALFAKTPEGLEAVESYANSLQEAQTTDFTPLFESH